MHVRNPELERTWESCNCYSNSLDFAVKGALAKVVNTEPELIKLDQEGREDLGQGPHPCHGHSAWYRLCSVMLLAATESVTNGKWPFKQYFM